MIAAAITVLPEPVGATRMMRRLCFARTIEFGDDVGLIRAQRGHAAPARARMLHAGPAPLRIVARTEAKPSSSTRPLRLAGVDQTLDHRVAVELTTGDQLKQPEGRAVERVVARAGRRGGERRDLGSSAAAAIARRVGIATATARWQRSPAPRSKAPASPRELDQPCRRGDQLGGRVDRPGIGAAARVDARRHDDVGAVAAHIDAGSDPAGRRGDRSAVGKPEMPPAAADHFARRRQCTVPRLERRKACLAPRRRCPEPRTRRSGRSGCRCCDRLAAKNA